jgi:hypothetical protein
MKYLLATITILFACLPANPQQSKANTTRMDQIVSYHYDHKQFMGSVLVIRGDQVLFDKSYGYANLEWDTPFTEDAKFSRYHAVAGARQAEDERPDIDLFPRRASGVEQDHASESSNPHIRHS